MSLSDAVELYFKMQSEDISRQYVHVFMDQLIADSNR